MAAELVQSSFSAGLMRGQAFRQLAAVAQRIDLYSPSSQAAPLLELVDAALHSVALFVCLDIECGRTASGAASPQAVADLVGGLRND
ncbi:hypothetical protein [Streptomyces sp. NPDC096934]|uniref:hypothetical protein n=1 Tax=Streptomyces sp. NPDC096934 TaxID=3155551 RepID=UPI00332F1623